MCGMSLLLSGNTINFWLASYGINTKIIGFFSLIVIPYVFKFLIAIFIENYKIPWLSNRIGHYKAWLFVSLLSLTIILGITSFLNPKQNLWLIALSGFLIAFFAVIKDIVLNHNRIKILDSSIQPAGSAIYTVGYRIGMLFSGAGVIFASVYFSWSNIYLILAGLYSVLTLVILSFYKETNTDEYHYISRDWHHIFIRPFKDFLVSKNFIWIALFILVYRLSDNMLMIMLNPFLLQLKYTAAEIASISKFFGIIMAIIGGVISGPIITKFSIRTSLIGFSIIHIFGNILLVYLSLNGKNIPLLYVITGYEAITGGMMMAAYFSFISNLCQGQHTATKYALLSSGMGLSRAIFPSFSGILADDYGWVIFFIIITCISIATTILTYLIPKNLFGN